MKNYRVKKRFIEDLNRYYSLVLRGRRRISDYEFTLDNWQENIKHEKKSDTFPAEDLAMYNEKLQKLLLQIKTNKDGENNERNY